MHHMKIKKKYFLFVCCYSIALSMSGCAYNQYMEAERARSVQLQHELGNERATQYMSEQERQSLLQEKTRIEAEIQRRKTEVEKIRQQLRRELAELTRKEKEAEQLDQVKRSLQQEKKRLNREMGVKIAVKEAEIKKMQKNLDDFMIY